MAEGGGALVASNVWPHFCVTDSFPLPFRPQARLISCRVVELAPPAKKKAD